MTGFEQEVTEETERRRPLKYGVRRPVTALDETSLVFDRVIADKESGDESPHSKDEPASAIKLLKVDHS